MKKIASEQANYLYWSACIRNYGGIPSGKPEECLHQFILIIADRPPSLSFDEFASLCGWQVEDSIAKANDIAAAIIDANPPGK